MTGASTAEVYYDPFDFDIDDDPYPIWKRLRDEAPLYYNDKYKFYALSRHEDVSRELMNFAGPDEAGQEAVDLSLLVEEMLGLLKISIPKSTILKTDLIQRLLRCLGPQFG